MPELKIPSSFRRTPITKQGINVPKRNSLIPTRAESDAEYDRQKNRTAWQSAKAFIGNIPEMKNYFEETWGDALKDESIVKGLLPEVAGGKGDPDAWKALLAMPEVGTRDLARMGKMIVERFKEDDNLPEETKKANHHRRQVEMMEYMTDARESLIEASAGGKYKGDIRAGADLTDVTNLAGGSSVMSKAYTGAIRKSIKGTAFALAPIIELGAKGAGVLNAGFKVPEKIAGSNTARMATLIGATAWATGGSGALLTPVALDVGQMATKFAEKVGRNTAEIARVFARPSSHERFLFRLSTDSNVSQKVRKLATVSYKLLGTKMYDVAFDALVGGVSAGALQTALQYASGATDEQAGMAFGTGVAMGAPVGGLLGSRGSGKDRASVNAQGNLTARSAQGIREYMARKNSIVHTEAITKLAKVSPNSAVLLSTMDALAPVEGMRLQILDHNEFAKNLGIDPKDVPSAHYDRDMGLITLNENDMVGAVNEATHIFAHDFGHSFMTQHLGADLSTRRQILESYEDPEGKEFYFLDEDGNKIGSIEPVRLNGDAVSFAQNYSDRIRKTNPEQADRILKDAGMLAEEIGADMFASYFGKDPNVFNIFEPQFRTLLMGGARNALSAFGIVDPKTGAQNAILPNAKIPKPLKNLFDNYIKESREIQIKRAEAVETGQKIFPKKGDTAQASFQKTNGGLTWDLLAGNDFVLKDKAMFDEFEEVINKVSADLDKKYVGLGRDASNQNMHPAIRDFLKKNSLRPDVVESIINMTDSLIASRERIRVGKRSGHQKQWSDYNPYYIHDITLFGYQFSPKAPRKNKNRKTGEERTSFPSMKVMAYNNEIVESNIQAMAQAGLLKKYNNDPQQFADALTEHSQKAYNKFGTEDPINPLGKGENELFAMAFGSDTLKADKLKDPINAQFWSKEGNGLKNGIKSYQIGELVGANTTGTKGFAVDYYNMKNNFMPSRSVGMNHSRQRKLNFMPKQFFMPSDSVGEGMSFGDLVSGGAMAKIKPYPMYPPTGGNMALEGKLKKLDIFNSDKSINMDKVRKQGLTKDIELAEKSGLLSVTEKLKQINYDTESQRNYRTNDPRRKTGNYLKDGNEYEGSSLFVGREKGRTSEAGEAGDGYIDFVHFPNQSSLNKRRKILKTKYHGSGIKGAEGKRRTEYKDLYVNRLYFGDLNYKPERGLNANLPHRTRIDSDNLWMGKPHYDLDQFLNDFEDFVESAGINSAGNGKVGNTVGDARQTAFETFIKDQGFLGMYSKQNNVGFMFHDIEVGSPSKPTVISYEPAFVPEGRKLSFMPSEVKRGQRVDELTQRAKKLDEGKLSPNAYQKAVDKYKPVDELSDQDIVPASREEMLEALGGKNPNSEFNIRRKGLIGAKIKAGENVGIRLDINAYTDYNTWIPTIHKALGKAGKGLGKVLSYDSVAVIDNADFGNQKNISLKIASGKIPKTSYARINGQWNPTSKKDAVSLAEQALANEDGSWTQVGFDPERHSYFYDRLDNSLALVSADQVVQVGRSVFAKNAVKEKAQKAFGKNQYYMPSKDYGILGNVENGDLLYSKSGDLHMMNHREPIGAPPRGNPWRYNAEEETVYWWEGMPSRLDKDTVTAHLERKGHKVKRNKHLDGTSKNFAKDYESAHAFPLKFMPDQADSHIQAFDRDIRINKIALDELTPKQRKLLEDNLDKDPSEVLGQEWNDLIKWATMHESVEPKIKALEGDKNAVESKLTMEDYTDNAEAGSVALSARMGIVNKNKKGMFPSYKAVTKLLHQLMNKIEYTMQKYPDFAKRTASFYSDMGRTALQMADIARVPNRTLFDVADLQLRFLALGSPRSAVSANMTKSARSLMSPHGAPSGHKINPTDQQIASSRTAIDWDNGKHFEVMDEKAIGASDKVRNFYLNGLSELVTIAKQEGTQADVDALLNKAGITLGVIKPNEVLTPEQTTFLDKTLDGLATVDMWDMAGKGYAHPAFVFEKNRTNLQKKNAFHWSVEKHRVRKEMNPNPSSQWAKAMREIGVKDASELNHQQANALQVDGFKYWNEDTWADRSIQGFEKDAQGKYPEFSFYRVADEDGLTPKGGGALYDAHQTVDGLLADEMNARGYAEFFGKDKLLARNAQEILWALTKLDNPLPSNQNLVLFGDRFKDLHQSINELRKNGSWIEKTLPKSAQAILGAINDTYSKTFTQNLPFEVTTFGKSKEAQAVQAQEQAMGVNDLTMSVAKDLGEQIQSIADNREVPILIEEVKVGHGGYTEDGVTVTSPNITIALRGDPKDTATVMVEISRALDQADGNVFRKPTLEEVNNGATLNEAVVFNTQGFSQQQKADFFTDLSKLQDSDGDTFLTGFTDSKQGMFIADLYYKPDRLNTEVQNNLSAIQQIMDTHGVVGMQYDVMIADKYSRPDPQNAVEFSKNTARTGFGRDIFTLLKHKIKTAQGRKFDGLPEILDREQRVIDQAYEASKGDYISTKQRDDAKAEVKEGVDLMTIEGLLDKDGNKRLKEEINVMFEGKYVPVKKKGKELNKKLFKRTTDPKAKITQTQKKNLLWAFRPQDKGFESGSMYFKERAWDKQAERLLGDQKTMDLNSPSLKKPIGIKRGNSYFNKSSKTGRLKK